MAKVSSATSNSQGLQQQLTQAQRENNRHSEKLAELSLRKEEMSVAKEEAKRNREHDKMKQQERLESQERQTQQSQEGAAERQQASQDAAMQRQQKDMEFAEKMAEKQRADLLADRQAAKDIQRQRELDAKEQNNRTNQLKEASRVKGAKLAIGLSKYNRLTGRADQTLGKVLKEMQEQTTTRIQEKELTAQMVSSAVTQSAALWGQVGEGIDRTPHDVWGRDDTVDDGWFKEIFVEPVGDIMGAVGDLVLDRTTSRGAPVSFAEAYWGLDKGSAVGTELPDAFGVDLAAWRRANETMLSVKSEVGIQNQNKGEPLRASRAAPMFMAAALDGLDTMLSSKGEGLPKEVVEGVNLALAGARIDDPDDVEYQALNLQFMGRMSDSYDLNMVDDVFEHLADSLQKKAGSEGVDGKWRASYKATADYLQRARRMVVANPSYEAATRSVEAERELLKELEATEGYEKTRELIITQFGEGKARNDALDLLDQVSRDRSEAEAFGRRFLEDTVADANQMSRWKNNDEANPYDEILEMVLGDGSLDEGELESVIGQARSELSD